MYFVYLLNEQAFSFIDLCFSLLHYFYSEFYDLFHSTNFGFFFVVVLFLVALGVRLGCLMFLLFLEVGLYCYEVPLSTAFTKSYRFCVVVFSLSLVSMHILSPFYFFSDLLVVQKHFV